MRHFRYPPPLVLSASSSILRVSSGANPADVPVAATVSDNVTYSNELRKFRQQFISYIHRRLSRPSTVTLLICPFLLLSGRG